MESAREMSRTVTIEPARTPAKTSLTQLHKYGTGTAAPSFRLTELVASLIALGGMIAAVGFFGESSIKQAVQQRARQSMESTLATAVASTESWLETNERAHRSLVRYDAFLTQARCLLESNSPACRRSATLSASPYLDAIEGCAFIVGAKVVEPLNCGSLSASQLHALGQRMKSVDGRSEFIPPFSLDPQHSSTGYVSSLSGGGLIFTQIDFRQLSRALLAARAGRSGETYAMDAQAFMVSESRFPHQLRQAGLLGPFDEWTTLRVSVRDPGVDLTKNYLSAVLRDQQNPTKAALSLMAGRSGMDVEGYRDYRGVFVIGAWRWLPRYQIGIVTEWDRDEAFASLDVLRSRFVLVLALFAAVAALLVMLGLLALRFRRREVAALARVESLGQYTIERKLGEGGMGTVYLARHMLLRRPTALKVLRTDRADQLALQRFEREVRTTSELFHPNTVSIYDFGRAEDGRFFYAMEFLEGLDLERLVSRYGPLPEERVVHFLVQACASLDEAHQRDLVHRDIKPSNLFACSRAGSEDLLKVLDFGIVKADWDERLGITQETGMVGTPEFMAPEMFDHSLQVTFQSDIYALGSTAYYLLTGSVVFETTTLVEACTAHLTELPELPSTRLGKDVDPAFERIVMACLEKMPSSRPDGARRLRQLLLDLPCASRWTETRARDFWKMAQPKMDDDKMK